MYPSCILNHSKRTITQDYSTYTYPKICSVCLEPSTNVIWISGTGHKLADVIRGIFHITRETRAWVVMCERCIFVERLRTVCAVICAALAVLLGWYLMSIAEPNDRRWALMGLAFLLLSPIAAAIYVTSSNRKPVIWNFNKTQIEIHFRNPHYLKVFQDWCLAENRLFSNV